VKTWRRRLCTEEVGTRLVAEFARFYAQAGDPTRAEMVA
jgi:hypothetical protein